MSVKEQSTAQRLTSAANKLVGGGRSSAAFAAKDPRRLDLPANRSSSTSAPSTAPASKPGLPQVKVTGKQNVLNDYRSYNYLFTLSAVDIPTLKETNDAKLKQQMLEECSKKYTILKSYGKGEQKISDTESGVELVKAFNETASAGFDFFINNIEIETIVAFNKLTGASQATKLRFDIYEPYSINNFIETIQVAAVAAGHEQYKSAAFVLKMEFKGYTDQGDLPSDAASVPGTTRFFVFSFTGMGVEVTEGGTKYSCTAVPFNDLGASSTSARLKGDIKASGKTVGELLKDFQDRIVENNKGDAKNNQGTDSNGEDRIDKYEILFAEVGTSGIDKKKSTNAISRSLWRDVNRDNNVYKMLDPGEANGEKQTESPNVIPVAQFARGTNIQDCISAVIRDSDYITGILKNIKDNIDQNGMVPYFQIINEVSPETTWNEITKSPVRTYRYIVIPYKIHYTKIPGLQNDVVDTSKLVRYAQREYNYIYTGKNLDILSFNLKFDNLYFQAIPQGMGATPLFSSAVNTQPDNTTKPIVGSKVSKDSAKKSALGHAPVIQDPTTNGNPQAAAGNSSPQQVDPYSRLAKNLHQAVLDNVSMVTAELEIIGDPFYLMQGGVAHFYSIVDSENQGVTVDGDAPYQTSDIPIVVNFRNPTDINTKTGFLKFDKNLVPFSGVFLVQTVASTFNDGIFKQRLRLIRIPGQVLDAREYQPSDFNGFLDVPNPADQASPVPPAPTSGLRPTAGTLLARGLPGAGLPGALSNFVNAPGGALGGVAAGVATLSGSLKQVSGAVSGGVNILNQGSEIFGGSLNGLNKLASGIRLNSAGLATASQTVSGTAAAVDNVSATAASAGIPKEQLTAMTKDALTSVDSAATAAAGVTAAGLATAASLPAGESAGLMSSISSKLDGLKGSAANLAEKFGVDPKQLSGLGGKLTSKLTDQLSDIAKTVPSNVDITAATKAGLDLNQIPVDKLSNIPATAPVAKAPEAEVPIKDVQAILASGGNISNIPGVANIPGINDVLSQQSKLLGTLNVPGLSVDTSMLTDKLSSVQKGIGDITKSVTGAVGGFSVEGGMTQLKSMMPDAKLPDLSKTAASIFGSKSADQSSPLVNLIKGKG